ncbi:MAG: hypothetical protein COA53_02140 [Rhodobacteraceae bacterium]|nr:MAG: hypothetical protein COA53_02140 [Paracoccaceae bacterium]
MAAYYVNTHAQDNGDHEVHTTGCPHPPLPQNRRQLGDHLNCQSAVRVAKTVYPTANGCFYCSNTCHTT